MNRSAVTSTCPEPTCTNSWHCPPLKLAMSKNFQESLALPALDLDNFHSPALVFGIPCTYSWHLIIIKCSSGHPWLLSPTCTFSPYTFRVTLSLRMLHCYSMCMWHHWTIGHGYWHERIWRDMEDMTGYRMMWKDKVKWRYRKRDTERYGSRKNGQLPSVTPPC